MTERFYAEEHFVIEAKDSPFARWRFSSASPDFKYLGEAVERNLRHYHKVRVVLMPADPTWVDPLGPPGTHAA